MRSSSLYRLAMTVAMLVVLLNFWLAGRALNTLFVAQGARAHTLEVLTHTKALELEVSLGNGAVRGYLLTADPSFITRYESAKTNIDFEVEKIQLLTADDPSQQQRIDYLRQRVRVKRAALETGVATRKSAGSLIDMAVYDPILLDSPDGGPSVYYCVQQIENEEQRLLIERTRETSHAQRHVWFSFVGVTILDIFLLGAAAELLIRTLRDRQSLTARAGEIATLNTELRSANEDLESRVAQRTRELAFSNQELEAFSYSVSHDLRAPLRTIDGFSLALQEDFADKLSVEGVDYINRVRNGVQRMGMLIDALLQLSRVTRSELQADEVDLSQLATLVFNELQSTGPAALAVAGQVEFIAQPDIHAHADARLMRIAFENLIGNAIKFTSKVAAPRILFGTRPGVGELAGQTVYFFQDNGAGFDMQYVDRLFTAFTRLHGDRDFKGSGIGLATVSRIIRRHHGTISAMSEPGQGATFSFTLSGEAAG